MDFSSQEVLLLQTMVKVYLYRPQRLMGNVRVRWGLLRPFSRLINVPELACLPIVQAANSAAIIPPAFNATDRAGYWFPAGSWARQVTLGELESTPRSLLSST
jgi:hypothetical protein